jgi:hypothetical protein
MRPLAARTLNLAKTFPAAIASLAAAHAEHPQAAEVTLFIPGLASNVLALTEQPNQGVSQRAGTLWNTQCALRRRNAAGMGAAQASPPAQLEVVCPPEGGARNDE